MSSLRSWVGVTLLATGMVAVGIVSACSSHSTNKPLVCQDTDSSSCTGTNGCEGTRECRDGTWTECLCASSLDGSGGSNPTTTTTGGDTTAGGGSSPDTSANTSGGSAGVGGDTSDTNNTSNASTATASGGAGGGSGASGGGTGGGTTTTGAGGGSTVHGTVVNHWLNPVPDVTVMIGDQQTTTDGDGEFEIENVPESYDVMLDLTYDRYTQTGHYGWVYQGVTRRDPTLQVYGGLDLREGDVLVQPMNVTQGDDRVVAMALGGQFGRWDREGATSSYSKLSYYGPPQVTMYGHGLQWVESDGLPTEYLAYNTTNLIAFDSDSSESVPFALDLTEGEVASGTISGSVTSPTNDARQNAVYVRFASNALIEVVKESGAEDSFTYTVPSLPDASILVTAHEGVMYDGARAVAYQNGLSSGATNVELTIPSAPALSAPVEGAVLADDTVFSWESDAQTFVWMLRSNSLNEGIHVVTTQKELSVPTFPNGLDLVRPGDSYTWRVEIHNTPDSVDAMLGSDGFMGDYNDIANDEPEGPGTGSGSYAASAIRLVTTTE